MLKKILFRDKFPTTLFVIASLSALLVIALIAFFAGLSTVWSKQKTYSGQNAKFFYNNKYKNDDEFITKNPSLKDLLAGPIISDADPSLGNTNSDVIIVSFSDYECKFCQKQEKILKQAMEKYKVRLIWKDYPQNDPNSKSYQAAIAARCAQEQNKFWEYHDALFAEPKLLNSSFTVIADRLKIDKAKFKNCFDKKATKQLVDNNITEANALNITGIPFIYVNDQEIMGEITFDELSRIIKLKAK